MLLLLLEAREVKTCIESLLFIDSLESRPDSGRVPLGESTSLYLLQVEGLCKLGYFPKNSPMFWMYLEQFSEEFKLSQAPLSMGFSRQEYWNGLPRPPPGESSQPRS